MKIAIYQHGGFSDRWVTYCKEHHHEYKLVNVYDSDIIEQVKGCDAFMWHHTHADYRDVLFAKQLIYSLETAGIKCFPDYRTTWHFDDKVGQKYLLEAVGAPLVPSYVFYTKEEAENWISNTTFPKVFKLRGGAGAANVMLARTGNEARRLVNKAFGKGFPQFDRKGYLKERYRKWRNGQDSFVGVLKGFARLFIPTTFAKMHPREKGYAYFQDFIPNNRYDIRVCVVGKRAFALKRMTRKDDFRASGSGEIFYDKSQIDERCIKIAFEVNEKLGAQSVAFDFVFDSGDNPLIVEISYGYSVSAYDNCEGYWTEDLQWHEGSHFDFCGWMVENLIKQ
ncbi:MAG: hypothetical protein K6A41_05770 [Bacteroidales bacterium]|nr:hypothetical protein [Bacteroidales bacterium]